MSRIANMPAYRFIFILLLCLFVSGCREIRNAQQKSDVASAPTIQLVEGLSAIPDGYSLFVEYKTVDLGCALWEEPVWLYRRHQTGILEIREDAPQNWPPIGFLGETDEIGYGAEMYLVEELPFHATISLLSVDSRGRVVVEANGQVHPLEPNETWTLASRAQTCNSWVEEAFTAVVNHGLLAKDEIVFQPLQP